MVNHGWVWHDQVGMAGFCRPRRVVMFIKANLIIALAVGALISAGLLVLEPLTDYALLSLEWPGITAAYFFWGAFGSNALLGIAIAWAVNAIAYGLGAFAILSVLRAMVTRPERST